ncbi:hypothetical protein TNCV_4555741 [Trichonephila clavipes]|nr:hypothetical protein TNCV_4555741 [Trichonephila clavipes]
MPSSREETGNQNYLLRLVSAYRRSHLEKPPSKKKPPLLRARTLPAIICPSLNIIQAQLEADASGRKLNIMNDNNVQNFFRDWVGSNSYDMTPYPENIADGGYPQKGGPNTLRYATEGIHDANDDF